MHPARSTNPHGDCYCDLWDRDPQVLRDAGVPEGYCGLCDSVTGGEVCGKPGHVRAHPGSYPVTACWCEEHYEAAARGVNPVRIGCAVLATALLLGIAWLVGRWIF